VSAKELAHFAEREQLRAVYSAKLHIIYYINERFTQNVKILTHFV
jgi:hypothetical protein